MIALAGIFALLSVLAFGGGNSILPEMQRQLVGVHHWLTTTQFSALFGLAQAAPGPNMMVATLLGWQIGGLRGAVVTTVATFGPSSVIAVLALRLWDRYRAARWRAQVQRGLIPVTAGLVAASALLIGRTAGASLLLCGILAAAALLALWGRFHPLWLLGMGAVIGATLG